MKELSFATAATLATDTIDPLTSNIAPHSPAVQQPVMRVKTQNRGDEDDYVTVVKTARSPTPVIAGGVGASGGGENPSGFWLASVNAASGGPHSLDGCNETGFINSQPSMAEFMTALPHLSNDMQGPPGGLSPEEPPSGYSMDPHGQTPIGLGSPGVNVPEYPWMKEKKTTRKSTQQGMWFKFLELYCFITTVHTTELLNFYRNY